MEIETRKWCKATRLIKPLRKMRILTYLGHDLTLTWPGLRSKFENDLSTSKVYFRTGSSRQTQWCHFYFRISLVKKVVNEKPSPWKTAIFHLVTSGGKAIDLRLNLIEKSDQSMKEAPQFLFRILPCYHAFGDNSACFRKKHRCFLKNWHLLTSGDLIIGLTRKWPL